MTDTTHNGAAAPKPHAIVSCPADSRVAAETSQEGLSELLAKLQDSAPLARENRQESPNVPFENQLALVRLGMATSLFYALRTKHPASAAHSLRVALICSAWAEHLGLDVETRDRLEVAALLHDLGKIGIPDQILRKPSKLTVEEQLTMDCCPELGCAILRGCTNDPELLSIVMHANAWYDSRRNGDGPRGDAIPMGSRMLSIVGAFDAMTTDHVYRSAISRERAIAELVSGSGAQFDPELVVDFARMLENQPELLHGPVVNRWLQKLRPEKCDEFWKGAVPGPDKKPRRAVRRETRFHTRLLTDLKDGVVFTDAQGTITHWNATMVKLTGVSSDAIVGKTWETSTFNICDVDKSVKDTSCPLKECFSRSAPVSRSMMISRKGCEPKSINMQVSPVSNPNELGVLGAVIIVHDNSERTDLEEQLETLHHKTTLDGLTGIANRAHFDEILKKMTDATTAGGPTFSLVICDIDHFKSVNDVHGHPAGDEALVSFAEVLRNHSRDGDLVARYGGEEFLLLASNCDNATAAKRAEAIRQALEQTPLPSLGNKSVTASFGVTEFQAGDTPQTVLSRSDRALLKAKDNGRNRVVQLGTGVQDDGKKNGRSSWLNWFESSASKSQTAVSILTPVPANLAIEKLKGFIADHDAEILRVNESQVTLKLNALCPTGGRRRVDQRIALNVRLTLSEARPDEVKSNRKVENTKVHVNLKPLRNRDRRNREFQGCVDLVISSLRSYLMGEVMEGSSE